MFLANHDGTLDAVNEDRPDTRESKRLKEWNQPPLLPDIKVLQHENFGGGDLGWDENAFNRT